MNSTRRSIAFNESKWIENVSHDKAKKDMIKYVEHFLIFINVVGVIVCVSLLINQISICISKYAVLSKFSWILKRNIYFYFVFQDINDFDI